MYNAWSAPGTAGAKDGENARFEVQHFELPKCLKYECSYLQNILKCASGRAALITTVIFM